MDLLGKEPLKYLGKNAFLRGFFNNKNIQWGKWKSPSPAIGAFFFDSKPYIIQNICNERMVCPIWLWNLIFRQSVGWPSPVQSTEGAWLALLMGVYAVWILFKLDLYMKREQRCRKKVVGGH